MYRENNLVIILFLLEDCFDFIFCEIDFVIVEEDELEECLKIVFVDKINDFKMDVDVDFVFEVN